ncbi:membrane protein [Lactiplantibacillus plantarum EGD-AQ4]|nr:membrane protein [Lactiplantibacillus plantarum EGD-AQ4]
MHIAATIMAIIVAVEHLFILWLEMFNADSELASKSFGIPRQTLQSPAVQLLFKNQGLYNGFLAVGILYSLFVIPAVASAGATLFFLACVMVAAVYGSITVSRAIVVIQGLPALIAFILMYLA